MNDIDFDIESLLSQLDELDESELIEISESLEAIEKKKYIEGAYNNLIKFALHVMDDYKVGAHHKQLAKLLTDIESGEKDRICVNIAPRHGKQVAHETPVLTTDGWKTHGDLRPGDFVFHPSGKPVRVLAISEDSASTMEVELTNGDVIKCHPAHEWTIWDVSAKIWRTVETEWFVSSAKRGPRVGKKRLLWSGKRGSRKSRARYQLPDVGVIEFDDKELPVDPYVFGCWLGDGTAGKSAITMSFEDAHHVLPEFFKAGYGLSATHVHLSTGVPTYSFGKGGGKNKRSPLTADLIKTGTFKNKHIPEIYLRSSVDQRLQLLAGLVDTDGHVEAHTGRCRIVTASYQLAVGILDICKTLGFRPYISTAEPTLSTSGIQGKRQVFTVGFQPTLTIPCRLPRKSTQKVSVRRAYAIADVREAKESSTGRCIQVASPDGLYLVGENLTPTHNSQLVSIIFIAWYIGRNPTHKIMLVSHTADLAVDFGRKVRNLVNSDIYREVFPNVNISADSKSAGRWNTNQGGEFYATGVGSALAGRGAHLLVIDDPHSEQDILNGNYEVFDKAYDWFTYGARTRLMKNGRIAIIQTRWHESDLTGRVVRDMIQNPKTDQYHVVEFPAIMEVVDKETGDTVEKALWPEMFDLDALRRIKEGMPTFQWNAQYQQNPTAEEAALIKREWWRKWKKENPPKCEYLIITLDAAAETHNRADFTGITVWGVFNNEEESAYQIIALDSIKQRYEFPELKRKAIEVYEYWQPDSFIVEKKSAGAALYQEMRRMGIPVQEYTPHRGSGDKVARINSVADIVSSGMVWVPETRWAEELVDEVAAFPFGANDDLVDCTYMALSRFRQGGFIRLPSDMKDEQQYFKRRKAYY